ncbi:baseplate J/gp47 family protein [Pyruvatibacter sp.]
MPFARPTLSQLREQVRDDLNANLPGADSRLKRGVLRVIGDVQAALVHMLYGYLDAMFKQCLPDTATGWFLERWANWFGLVRKAAAVASGSATVTGTDGAVINAGVQLSDAAGTLYDVTTGATISGGTATLAVEAVLPGADGNADAGTVLTFVAALAGVDAQGSVGDAPIAGGAEEETDTALRARLSARIKQPPHGGSQNDYKNWALEVPGVTRAWAEPAGQGVGTVVVRVMLDDVRAEQAGIPQGAGAPDYTGDLALVHDYIDPLRPVTVADWFVAAPIPVALDLTINNLTPDTPETRAAVEAEINALLLREGNPGATIYLAWIYEAISIATGERHHAITAPAADIEHTAGQIAVPGVLTFTNV